jgi:hypothetical protein
MSDAQQKSIALITQAIKTAQQELVELKNYQRLSLSAHEEIGVPLGEWYDNMVADIARREAQLELVYAAYGKPEDDTVYWDGKGDMF